MSRHAAAREPGVTVKKYWFGSPSAGVEGREAHVNATRTPPGTGQRSPPEVAPQRGAARHLVKRTGMGSTPGSRSSPLPPPNAEVEPPGEAAAEVVAHRELEPEERRGREEAVARRARRRTRYPRAGEQRHAPPREPFCGSRSSGTRSSRASSTATGAADLVDARDEAQPIVGAASSRCSAARERDAALRRRRLRHLGAMPCRLIEHHVVAPGRGPPEARGPRERRREPVSTRSPLRRRGRTGTPGAARRRGLGGLDRRPREAYSCASRGSPAVAGARRRCRAARTRGGA